MKALIRWLVAPVIRWLATGAEFKFIRGCDESAGVMVFIVLDEFGNTYSWTKTPDEVRDEAWQMIHDADELDAEYAIR